MFHEWVLYASPQISSLLYLLQVQTRYLNSKVIGRICSHNHVNPVHSPLAFWSRVIVGFWDFGKLGEARGIEELE